MNRWFYTVGIALLVSFLVYSCRQQQRPGPPPINPADLVGRWQHEQLGVWEFTIEPSGAQRFRLESFGLTALSAHWQLTGRRLRFENVTTGMHTGVALLDLLIRDEASDKAARKHLNDLEIRALSRTTLTLGQAGNNDPKEQITFQRE